MNFVYFLHTWPMCLGNSSHIYFLAPRHTRPFSKMAAWKVCRHDILITVEWIPFKFDVVVLWVVLMIWLPFGKKSLKTRWMTEDKKWPTKNFVGAISYEQLVGSHLFIWLTFGNNPLKIDLDRILKELDLNVHLSSLIAGDLDLSR